MLQMKFTTKRYLLCTGLRKRKSPTRSYESSGTSSASRSSVKMSSISNTIQLVQSERCFVSLVAFCKHSWYMIYQKPNALADEVCNVSNKEQLVTFVKFVHCETGKPNTAFLAASNLLENSSSADAETIINAIVVQLEDAGIHKKKLSSFSSDGASVMTGKRNGVGARL